MKQPDRIRLEEFRQFKKEIRASREYLIVGIDAAKDRHVAFFGTAMGKALFQAISCPSSTRYVKMTDIDEESVWI